MSNSRSYHKTFQAYLAAMKIAREGKTFIIMSKDFVAIDMRTWERLNRDRNMPIVSVDEAGMIDPNDLRTVDIILKNMK